MSGDVPDDLGITPTTNDPATNVLWERHGKTVHVGLVSAGGWRIDPETLSLTGPMRGRSFSGAEFNAQQWPPCLVCGTTVIVDRVDIQSYADPLPVYIPGRWQCPNECDPRRT